MVRSDSSFKYFQLPDMGATLVNKRGAKSASVTINATRIELQSIPILSTAIPFLGEQQPCRGQGVQDVFNLLNSAL